MTYEKDYTISEELMEEICEQGLDALPELMRIVLNAAMYIERQKHIGAGPYERTPERRGHANGFKPRPVLAYAGNSGNSHGQGHHGHPPGAGLQFLSQFTGERDAQ